MTNKTPSGARKCRKCTKPESRQMAKIFFLLLLLLLFLLLASSKLRDAFTTVFVRNSGILHWAVAPAHWIFFTSTQVHKAFSATITQDCWIRYMVCVHGDGELFGFVLATFTQCLNKCLVSDSSAHTPTEEACEDRLFAVLCELADLMHLLLTKKVT